MPRWKACSYPSCPELITGATRCPEHTVKADDTYRPNATRRGYDTKWKTERARFLKNYPDCCIINCDRKATDVDHIDALGPLGPHGYDWNNLRPLCHQHHSAITAATTWSKRPNPTG